MTVLSRIECERAPCGCPAAPRTIYTNTRYSQPYSATCPGIQGGRVRQHASDLCIPLNQAHVEYYDTLYTQARETAQSWHSGSTQAENIVSEEGYSRFNRDGLSATFGLPLTPEYGVNMNEPHQMERAVIRGRARAISESMARYVEPEQQDDIVVDENGDPVYSSPRSMRMGPCYFQPPTRPYGTEVAQYGNPSSRGQSSNHHSGCRSSHDQSSSGRGGADPLTATGEQFADYAGQEYDGNLSVSGYDVEDAEIFQYEN